MDKRIYEIEFIVAQRIHGEEIIEKLKTKFNAQFLNQALIPLNQEPLQWKLTGEIEMSSSNSTRAYKYCVQGLAQSSILISRRFHRKHDTKR